MKRTVAVIETPLLAGQGLVDWLGAQPGFAARPANDWSAAEGADVVLLDLSRGEHQALRLLKQGPRQPLPLVAIDSDAHPLPGRWRDWLGPAAVLTVPVAGDGLLAALRRAAAPAPGTVAALDTPPVPGRWDALPPADHAAWSGAWDGLHFPALAPAGAPDDPVAGPAAALTRREREIARLVASGLSNREIGERLFVAVGTVRKHRENLMTKLEVRNARALTQWALAAGLLGDGEGAADPARPSR